MEKMTVALYMRLSKEDDRDASGGPEKNESNSIGNQRKLLMDFLKRKREFSKSAAAQYVDDGYSGTGFERPGFIKMMEDIKKGKVQCVIVKDFSRFGRDYIELGDYIEHIFPFLQVRFISVNDGYDSEEYRGKTPDIDVPFRNLAYALYSQDISEKIKSSLAVRRKKGLYIGALPPYGYQRDRNGFLTPDEETKETVQRIFREFLSGTGLTELAKILNAEGLPSPGQHKINKGLLREEKGKSCFWTPATIHRILRNETYTGVLSAGAYKSGPVGSGKRIFVPEDERVRVEGAHPPIISKEVFWLAQEKMDTKEKGEARRFLLKGLVRCGVCGRIMVKDKEAFRCRYQRFTGHRSVESIPEAKLEEIVLKAANIRLQLFQEREAVLGREKELCEEKRKRLHRQMKKKKLQAERKGAEIRQLYRQYRQGAIGKAAYLARKEQERLTANEREKELAGMKAEEERLQRREEQAEAGRAFLSEWLKDGKDRRELLQCLLAGIDVYPEKKLAIHWRFQEKEELCHSFNTSRP